MPHHLVCQRRDPKILSNDEYVLSQLKHFEMLAQKTEMNELRAYSHFSTCSHCRNLCLIQGVSPLLGILGDISDGAAPTNPLPTGG